MSRKEVRRDLLVYRVFGPWVFLGIFFFGLLFIVSFFVPDNYSRILQKGGLAGLISAVVLGVFFSILFIYRTRTTNKDERR